MAPVFVYVLPVVGLSAYPEYLSVAQGTPGSQQVIPFTLGMNVTQGTIIVPNPNNQALPLPPYQPWQPPVSGFWVAMTNQTLPTFLPAYGAGTDALHFSLGPSFAGQAGQ